MIKGNRQKMSMDEIVHKMEKTYPYQLNNQKKLKDLFKELDPEIQFIEITEAPRMRAKTLWSPLLAYYEEYLSILNEL